MIQRRDAVYIRSDIIGKAQGGKWTPDRAEAVAKRLDAGPLASLPYAFMYDPMRQQLWTMPMAVAWIAWRTEDAVRDSWDEYRKNCWDWHFRESQTGFEGPVTGGFFLEARSKASMHLLILSDSNDRVMGEVDADAAWWISVHPKPFQKPF
jgi:hypothetical protein